MGMGWFEQGIIAGWYFYDMISIMRSRLYARPLKNGICFYPSGTRTGADWDMHR